MQSTCQRTNGLCKFIARSEKLKNDWMKAKNSRAQNVSRRNQEIIRIYEYCGDAIGKIIFSHITFHHKPISMSMPMPLVGNFILGERFWVLSSMKYQTDYHTFTHEGEAVRSLDGSEAEEFEFTLIVQSA